MATQKEKIISATIMSHTIKSIAKRLEYDANDYDVKFPLEYSKQLTELADKFLKLK